MNKSIEFDKDIYLELLYIESVIVFIEQGIEKVETLLLNTLYGGGILHKMFEVIESGEDFPHSYAELDKRY